MKRFVFILLAALCPWLSPAADLSKSTNEQLVETLGSTNSWQRRQAQWLYRPVAPRAGNLF
jgi:hypothetical protein